MYSAGAADLVLTERDKADGEELHPEVEYVKVEWRRATFCRVFPVQQGWELGWMPAIEKFGTFLADGP